MGKPVVYFEIAGTERGGPEGILRQSVRLADLPNMLPPAATGTWRGKRAVSPGGIMQTTEDMPPELRHLLRPGDDIQECLDQAESLEARPSSPPTPVPGGMGHIGVFQDPSGNSIGLHKF